MRKISFMLAAALLLSCCFPACADTVFDLGSSKYALSGQTAFVSISPEAVNTVKSGIFGANTSYIGGGYGLYDEENRCFNDALLEKLTQSGVTHVRLPGGIEGDYFHWYECVGPVESRLAQINCFSSEYPTYTYKNGEPYDVLFGPDEWFELCRRTGSALTLQLNAGNGTPQEAADFVRYCLDSGVEIESITVGNEVCMAAEKVAGIRVTKSADEYIEFYEEVFRLLDDETKRELAERGIPFGCIGIPASHPLNRERSWDSAVLKALGDKTDFIDVHIAYSPYYVSGNRNDEIIKCLLASSELVRRHLKTELTSIERFAPSVKIAICEHGPLGAIPYSAGMAGGLYLASFFQLILNEEKVISADYLPLTNHPAANNLLGYYNELGQSVFFDNVVTHIFRMYSEQIGRSVLRTEISGAKTFSSVSVGLMSAVRNVPEADAALYYDEEIGSGTLFLINKAYSENTVFDVTLPFDDIRIDSVTEMFTPNNTMYNSYTRPELVKPIDHSAECAGDSEGHMICTLKPVSLLKIDFTTPNLRSQDS